MKLLSIIFFLGTALLSCSTDSKDSSAMQTSNRSCPILLSNIQNTAQLGGNVSNSTGNTLESLVQDYINKLPIQPGNSCLHSVDKRFTNDSDVLITTKNIEGKNVATSVTWCGGICSAARDGSGSCVQHPTEPLKSQKQCPLTVIKVDSRM